MSEFFFVAKTALFSVLLLMLLQMKIGGETLETHSENWVYGSRVGHELQHVASGAVRAGYEGWSWLKVQTHEVGKTMADKTSAEPSARETFRERSLRSRPRVGDDLD